MKAVRNLLIPFMLLIQSLTVSAETIQINREEVFANIRSITAPLLALTKAKSIEVNDIAKKEEKFAVADLKAGLKNLYDRGYSAHEVHDTVELSIASLVLSNEFNVALKGLNSTEMEQLEEQIIDIVKSQIPFRMLKDAAVFGARFTAFLAVCFTTTPIFGNGVLGILISLSGAGLAAIHAGDAVVNAFDLNGVLNRVDLTLNEETAKNLLEQAQERDLNELF